MRIKISKQLVALDPNANNAADVVEVANRARNNEPQTEEERQRLREMNNNRILGLVRNQLV